MNILWFKKDLRTTDHAALAQACDGSSVLPLYIIEPTMWQQADQSYRHYQQLLGCLCDLDRQLQALGQKLIIRVGEAVPVLEEICQNWPVRALFSHQETGNSWSYERDKKVIQWAKKREICWHQPRQNGVIRGLKDRESWRPMWYHWVREPLFQPPTGLLSLDISSEVPPLPEQLGLQYDGCSQAIASGRTQGLKRLESFLAERGKNYGHEMSSPLTAEDSCSRLSIDLAWGTLSLREVFQSAERSLNNVLCERETQEVALWRSSLRSFTRRLRWHCHFIQKLESQPEIECESMHSAYRELWQKHEHSDKWLQAWKTGHTGYPFVDACMRALITTGWMNFRMRAMLVSFASHHLWLRWQETAPYLAQLFIDYEPGIHYSQMQMQSGSTGMNIIRLYNPIKQSQTQDLHGEFIRKWVPELAHLDNKMIHTPWKDSKPPQNYPKPLVDEKTARTQAASRLYAVSRDRTETEKLVKQHCGGDHYKRAVLQAPATDTSR